MRKIDQRLLLGGVLLITILLYLPSIWFEYINLDDPYYYLENPDVLSFDLFKIFSFKTLTLGDWTPLATISYWFEYKIFGIDSRISHGFNLALHLINGVLLFSLLKKIETNKWLIFYSALIFLIHPLQIESVAWISSRKNLLCAAFYTSSLILLLDSRYLLTILFGFLALCSKGTAVTLPIVGIIILWLKNERDQSRSLRSHLRSIVNEKNLLLTLLLLFVFSGLRGVLSLQSQKMVIWLSPANDYLPEERIAIALKVMAFQIIQFFYPKILSVYYEWPASNEIYFEALGFIAVGILVFWLSFKISKTTFASLLIYLIILLPTANIVPAPMIQADRYLYQALPWLCLVFGALLSHYLPPKTVFLTAAVHAILLMPLNQKHLFKWQNSSTLWAREYIQNAQSHQIQFNLGTILEEEDKINLAIDLYKKSFYGRLANVPSCELLIAALLKTNNVKGAVGYLRACVTKHGLQKEFQKLDELIKQKQGKS
ncbi:MAG TPA: hypothetical protein PKD37_02730 [Oligoflexia bacterium]|nr:hypothetical protein [Oligoflexia bacterium]HMP26881.1 hypothetical protein [Oligoflexia bacterium]